MKKIDWKSYFHFSKKERNATLIIIAIIGSVTAASMFWKTNDNVETTHQFVQTLTDSATKLSSHIATYHNNVNQEIDFVNFFEFDPNTLDENGWKKLGLPERNIHTILNYRNKGGRFYKPEDIKKIYGLNQSLADKLIPYIHIKSNIHQHFSNYSSTHSYSYQNKSSKEIAAIDINTATADEWKNLPGIGEVLSKRIVKFRTAKHGFKSIDEVKKTYGISDSTFNLIRPYLTINDTLVQQQTSQNASSQTPATLININTASEQQMRDSHKISYSIIKAIIIYREQHNGFTSVDELKKIPFISEETYNNISPYLTVKNE
ncbi:hypothetical protein A9P82_06370 [Arachidicoccus ginsenosidimutans]|uniref:ComEA family DNA-binding protein n=1 Tax=Arachidicoccus sp. BS20 TaxID=1850526 RepID=UPI0007F06003|nr:helix-hairpin-helix domain-containing protein [Arachidicoccus sp. BS20]ANI88951.1 hypothetical protein A9P82_06370 [Arachidicoccus sp. BS20]